MGGTPRGDVPYYYIEQSKEYRRGGTSVYARLRCKEHHTTTNQW